LSVCHDAPGGRERRSVRRLDGTARRYRAVCHHITHDARSSVFFRARSKLCRRVRRCGWIRAAAGSIVHCCSRSASGAGVKSGVTEARGVNRFGDHCLVSTHVRQHRGSPGKLGPSGCRCSGISRQRHVGWRRGWRRVCTMSDTEVDRVAVACGRCGLKPAGNLGHSGTAERQRSQPIRLDWAELRDAGRLAAALRPHQRALWRRRFQPL